MKNKKLLTGILSTMLSVTMLCFSVNVTQETKEASQISEVTIETGDVAIPNDEIGIPDENLYNEILEVTDINDDGLLTISNTHSEDYFI